MKNQRETERRAHDEALKEAARLKKERKREEERLSIEAAREKRQRAERAWQEELKKKQPFVDYISNSPATTLLIRTFQEIEARLWGQTPVRGLSFIEIYKDMDVERNKLRLFDTRRKAIKDQYGLEVSQYYEEKEITGSDLKTSSLGLSLRLINKKSGNSLDAELQVTQNPYQISQDGHSSAILPTSYTIGFQGNIFSESEFLTNPVKVAFVLNQALKDIKTTKPPRTHDCYADCAKSCDQNCQ